MELPLTSKLWSDHTPQLECSAQLSQLDVWYHHRKAQAKVDQESHNSSPSGGGTSTLLVSGPQSHSPVHLGIASPSTLIFVVLGLNVHTH